MPWQELVFLATVLSASFGLLGVGYSYLNRRKLREMERSRDFLTWAEGAVVIDFYKRMIDDLERRNDLWPVVLTVISVGFAVFAAVLVYVFIR